MRILGMRSVSRHARKPVLHVHAGSRALEDDIVVHYADLCAFICCGEIAEQYVGIGGHTG